MVNHYCIRTDYRHRQYYTHFDDTPNSDKYQRLVYKRAASLARACDFRTVIDIGCGSGYKLVRYLGFLETIGTEVEPTLTILRNRYTDKKWIKSDFNVPPVENTDLVICSDVVEHLLDADELMRLIASIRFRILFLSTPDRDAVVKTSNSNPLGPPRNIHHIREWNHAEFCKYASQFVNVLSSFGYDGGIGQCVIATPKKS